MTARALDAAYDWRWRLGLLALIWGSSFLLIKLALPAFSPLAIATLRMWLGFITLLVALVLTRDRLPRDPKAWLHAGTAGVFANALPFTLVGIGVAHSTSILGAIWNATTPLIVLVISMFILREEHATRRRVGGTVLGFVGVLVLLGAWRGGAISGDLTGHLALAGAALCYGTSTPYMRHTLAPRPESTIALSAAQIGCASIVLSVVLALAPASERDMSLELTPILAMLALGVAATGVAYLLFTSLVRGAGASVASSVTYLMPLVAATLGVLVLDERVQWNEPLGCLVILAGVAIASTTRRRAAAPDGLGVPGDQPSPRDPGAP